ncbi:MAG: Imm52 family immunity protein [Beijerinckiaceae bacterium]|nr:Imm52 family immunity protein [Beijerinckiaceae bacterium]
MNMKMHYLIDARLPPKQETLATVTERVAKLLTSLREIDPLLSRWFQPTGPETRLPLSASIPLLEKAIYAQSCLNGAKSPRLEFGYCLGASNQADSNSWKADGMMIMMNAGGRDANRIWLQTSLGIAPDPRLIAYSTVKKILFAVADAFDPLFSSAYPAALNRDLMIPEGKKRPIFVGWMVLLPRDLAIQVMPPPQTIQQTRADGSLFMAATDETFDASNPAHVAGSKAIQDAIAPVNIR